MTESNEFGLEKKSADSSEKKKRYNCIKPIWHHFVEYSENSTFDGVRYLGDRNLHKFEKLFWMIVFVFSITTSVYLITNLYAKWQESPVIVSFSEKSKPAWQIPFPAVTICPETKAVKDKVDFTEMFIQFSRNESMELFSTEQWKNFEAMSQICDTELFKGKKARSGLKTQETVRRLLNISLTMDEAILSCKFKDSSISCADLFQTYMTEEGTCFTFNMLDRSKIYSELAFTTTRKDMKKMLPDDWTLETGYKTNNPEAYPRRVLGRGALSGLVVLLQMNKKNLDYICRGPIQGFRVLLHPPDEFPNVRNDFFQVPLGQSVLVTVKPDMIETSDELQKYSPEKRQCFFSHEKKLRFYKVYSQTNCESECLANFMNTHCGCVHPSMPHDNETRVCGINDIGCSSNAQKEMSLLELTSRLEKLDRKTGKDSAEDSLVRNGSTSENKTKNEFQSENIEYKDCNCLPACTSINYGAEVTQSDMKFQEVINAFTRVAGQEEGEADDTNFYSRLTIFYKDSEIITSKRSELYGIIDFIANCGGLIGLFIGGSIISLVEIFFYITLRPFFKIRGQKENLSS